VQDVIDTQLGGFSAASKVTHLRVMHCPELTNLTGIQRLKHIVEANLSSNSLISMASIEPLYKLQYLNLSCNKLQHITGLRLM
jgi:hypothetical protein